MMFKTLVSSVVLTLLISNLAFGVIDEEEKPGNVRKTLENEQKRTQLIQKYHEKWDQNRNEERTKPLSRLYSNKEGALQEASHYIDELTTLPAQKDESLRQLALYFEKELDTVISNLGELNIAIDQEEKSVKNENHQKDLTQHDPLKNLVQEALRTRDENDPRSLSAFARSVVTEESGDPLAWDKLTPLQQSYIMGVQVTQPVEEKEQITTTVTSTLPQTPPPQNHFNDDLKEQNRKSFQVTIERGPVDLILYDTLANGECGLVCIQVPRNRALELINQPNAENSLGPQRSNFLFLAQEELTLREASLSVSTLSILGFLTGKNVYIWMKEGPHYQRVSGDPALWCRPNLPEVHILFDGEGHYSLAVPKNDLNQRANARKIEDKLPQVNQIIQQHWGINNDLCDQAIKTLFDQE